MISFRSQLILLFLSIILLLILLKRIREYKLDLKYSLLWIVINIFSIFIVAFPSFLQSISELIGIKTPANTLFLFAITSILIIQYSTTNNISKMANTNKDLTQEIGLLRNELESIKRKHDEI